MSEVENHYGHDRAGPASSGQGASPKAAAADAVRGTLDTAARKAEDVRGSVNRAYGQATNWASDTHESASRYATYARRRSAAESNRSYRTVESFVEENPIMVGVVGLAAGLLVGALLPGTRQENRVFGRYADEVRSQGLKYAQDVAEQGRALLDENLKQVRRDRDSGDETHAG